ncbi:MAG: hypothetical protein Q9P44_11530 [Anaerolineae bacterium]|nr:hypothetical protein [Anaerolineae bacterium]
MYFLLTMSFLTLMMTLRSFLIVLGTYKDPVLASFEHYGEEKVSSPIFTLIVWATLFLYFALFLYYRAGILFILGLVTGTMLASMRDRLDDWRSKYHAIFRMFPRWYFELVQRTDREERRRIAYLWLRLPLQTRLLYNAHSEYFHQWVDLVLLSITR